MGNKGIFAYKQNLDQFTMTLPRIVTNMTLTSDKGMFAYNTGISFLDVTKACFALVTSVGLTCMWILKNYASLIGKLDLESISRRISNRFGQLWVDREVLTPY